jgi:hypothetical protein
MIRLPILILLAILGLSGAPEVAIAQRPQFGFLYHDGTILRTIVPPARSPMPGRDDLYMVTNGVEGQLGVAAVAPGDVGYHGGHWAVHLVTFIDEPILLTSEAEVLAAEAVGLVVIDRAPELDFRCPIQP